MSVLSRRSGCGQGKGNAAPLSVILTLVLLEVIASLALCLERESVERTFACSTWGLGKGEVVWAIGPAGGDSEGSLEVPLGSSVEPGPCPDSLLLH